MCKIPIQQFQKISLDTSMALLANPEKLSWKEGCECGYCIRFCVILSNICLVRLVVCCVIFIVKLWLITVVGSACMWMLQASAKPDVGDILERMSRCKKAVVNLERKVMWRLAVLLVCDVTCWDFSILTFCWLVWMPR